MSSFVRRCCAGAAAVVLTSAFAVGFGQSTLSTTAQAAGSVAVQLSAPATARVGDTVAVKVTTTQPVNVAAFEVPLLVDSAAGEVEGSDTNVSGVPHREPMSFIDANGGVLGAYTPVGAGATTSSLGTVYVRLTAPGRVELRTGPVVLADSNGARLDVSSESAVVAIDVSTETGASSAATFAAPTIAWDQPDGAAGADAFATLADARSLWQTSRLAGTACSSAQAAQAGGCIDIADVQKTVAVDGPAIAPTSADAPNGPGLVAAGPFTVNSTGDQDDANVGNGVCATAGGVCTLRAAIRESNSDGAPTTINFGISGAGVHTIQLGAPLPIITDGNTTIDGYTQPGSAPNTNASPNPDNAQILIQIVGQGAVESLGGFDAFDVQSAGNLFRGLSIYDVKRPFWVNHSAASGNVIQGNFIGTNAAGTFYTTTDDANGHGVHIQMDAVNTVIGGTLPAQRNVISGNARSGVGIWDAGSDNTTIYGNIIGLNPQGTGALPNRMHGVDFNFGVSGTQLGGLAAGQLNVISGNGSNTEGSGVEISHTAGTTDNHVIGNYIGSDLTGNGGAAFHNGNTGVYIEDGASNNEVANNVIVNNVKGGVRILNGSSGVISTGNVVRNNRIGITLNGTTAGNGQLGVSVDGVESRIDSNTIVGNGGAGILSGLLYTAAVHNRFTRNSIYDNVGLSIDLIDSPPPQHRGITFNDPGDGDTGPNTLLNYPVLSSAETTGAAGNACPGCTVELFATGATPSANGVGPARTFVAATTANAQGQFSVGYAPIALAGKLTATAQDAAGNTSELAPNVTLVQGSGVAPPPPPPAAPPGSTFVTMTPARLLDTRPGFTTVDGLFQGIGLRDAGSVTELQVTGRDNVPADAVAVALNVTVTETTLSGFVTVYPCGEAPPTASNLNYVPGSTSPNLVVSKIGVDGKVCLFTSNPVQLIADLNGFFPPGAHYVTMSPARVMDTRTGNPTFVTVDGQYQGIGPRGAGVVTELQITGRANVPSGAAAVAINLTATGGGLSGFVTAYPCDAQPPTASNLNFVPGSTNPNLVMSKLSADGKLCLFTSNPIHLVADVNGYFEAASNFVTMSPARVLETRTGNPTFVTVDGQFQGIGIRDAGSITELQITGRVNVPAGATSVALNVTATGATAAGYVTAYPCGGDPPNASNLNFVPGSTNPNLVIAQIGIDGKVCLFTSAPTHLVADINGYFPLG